MSLPRLSAIFAFEPTAQHALLSMALVCTYKQLRNNDMHSSNSLRQAVQDLETPNYELVEFCRLAAWVLPSDAMVSVLLLAIEASPTTSRPCFRSKLR
jgi:hypothetical protein